MRADKEFPAGGVRRRSEAEFAFRKRGVAGVHGLSDIGVKTTFAGFEAAIGRRQNCNGRDNRDEWQELWWGQCGTVDRRGDALVPERRAAAAPGRRDGDVKVSLKSAHSS